MPVEIDIDHVARLARLDLTDDEKVKLTGQLAAILEHASTLAAVATADVPPSASAMARSNVDRDDVVEPSLSVEAALRNAPDREGDRFRVPRVVEGG